MAQSESVTASPPPRLPLPFEIFLATEDPVWVWDGKGRRIIWANAAAAALWGDRHPERLKRRRLSKKSSGIVRMTEFARNSSSQSDSLETLVFPTAQGERTIRCYLQKLELADARPGLVVRVLTPGKPVLTPPDRAVESTESAVRRRKTKPRATTAAVSRRSSALKKRNDQRSAARRRAAIASKEEMSALTAIAEGISEARHGLASAERQLRDPPATMGKKRSVSTTQPPQQRQTGRAPRPTSKKPEAAVAPPPKQPAATTKAAGRSRRQAPPTARHTGQEAGFALAADVRDLLAQVSHEIRNPLTIIMGFAELLQGERLARLAPEKIGEYANDIYRTAQFALVLANDLLTYTEHSRPREWPRHAPVDLNALVADCLHLLAPVAKSQGIALRRRLARTAPLVLGDERSLRQVLLNLLMNSMRHRKGNGYLRVMTRINKAGELLVSVRDDGPGMTAERIAAALDPGAPGAQSRKQRHGLGLRLVSLFVRANHGRLTIVSKPGQGTDVRITFPAERLVARSGNRSRRRHQSA